MDTSTVTTVIDNFDGTCTRIDPTTGELKTSPLAIPPTATGKEHFVTSTGRILTVGVPTRVGPYIVTITVMVGWESMVIAHVEGPKNALKMTRLRRLLGSVRRRLKVVDNWTDRAEGWSEWEIRNGTPSTDECVRRDYDPEQGRLLREHASHFGGA